MPDEITYPSVEEIVELNVLILGIVRVKKADKHEVLSSLKISKALDACRDAQGDVYDKAAVMMRALASTHAFASGNRRTAFLAAKELVLKNGGKFAIPDDPHYASVMREIRERKHSDAEITEWIKHGKIRQAKP